VPDREHFWQRNRLRGVVLFNRGTRHGDRQAGRPSGTDAVDEARLVGAELTTARDRLGWTLPDVAAHLRIRLSYLEAIEEGRLDQLPGRAYAMGFVRTYAKSLGLDPDDIARRFRPEVKQAARKPELAFPAPVPERGVPAGAVVLLGATLAIGAYIGWYQASGEKPGAEPVRPVPERLAELTVPPPVPQVSSQTRASQSPVSHPPASQAGAALQPPLPGAPISTDTPAAAAVTTTLTPLPVIPPSSAAAAVVPGAISPGSPDGTRIVLRARADAWIQVRDRQGQVLLNRVLRPGETWPVPPRLSLLMTTGNAGGTELLVDGAATSPLGADGAVRRDLPLDADAIRDGKLAPAAAIPARATGR
jgi:cytoskeleton protein RodZ